jgi:hypothetical protein
MPHKRPTVRELVVTSQQSTSNDAHDNHCVMVVFVSLRHADAARRPIAPCTFAPWFSTKREALNVKFPCPCCRKEFSRMDKVVNHLKLSSATQQPKCKEKHKRDEASKQHLLSLLGGVGIEQGGEQ